MRTPKPTGQQMDLAELPQYWQVVAKLFGEIERLPPLAGSTTLSARAFDESQTAGQRTYMGVDRYLSVARDNHEALLALLEHHGATLWAPWSLLRPTFESAFYAAWILDPSDGKERRARGLRVEVRDAYEQRNHRRSFREIPEVRDLIDAEERRIDAGSMSTYKKEASALGRSFDTIRRKVNVVEELPKLSFIRDQPTLAPFLVSCWRLLSGFEHGLGWAMLSGSDREVTAHIEGGAEMHLVISDESFVTAAKSTYFLLLAAGRLLVRRHTRAD